MGSTLPTAGLAGKLLARNQAACERAASASLNLHNTCSSGSAIFTISNNNFVLSYVSCNTSVLQCATARTQCTLPISGNVKNFHATAWHVDSRFL